MKEKNARKSARQQIEERTESMAAPVAEQFGVYIYDVEYVREGQEYFLTVYIDKEGGVTIDDCENVSRILSDELDREDMLRDPYTLVVSSPGLGRALTKDRHLQQSIGREVEVHLYRADPVCGQKDLRGELLSFDEGQITILLQDAPVRGKSAGKKGKGIKKNSTDELTAGSCEEPAETPKAHGLSLERKEIASIRLAFDF